MDDISQALSGLNLNLSTAHSTDETIRAVHILAEASKTDQIVRHTLGRQNILEQLVAIVDSSLNDSLETVDVALRCIGNACIDNDEARANVTALGFSWATRCLASTQSSDLSTAILTAKVLYNICLDFDPAQQQCYRERVHVKIIDLCALAGVGGFDDMPLLLELLFYISSQKEALKDTDVVIPESSLRNLLLLPSLLAHGGKALETDLHAMLIETCLGFLRDPQVQRDVCQNRLVAEVLKMLGQNEERCQNSSEEDQKLLAPLSISLIWVLSDIAALPEFSQSYTLDAPLFWTDIIPIMERPYTETSVRYYTAAGQVLGNRLWATKEPRDFTNIIQSTTMHLALLEAIRTAEDTELLHSAAGVLLQLFRLPLEAREMMASVEGADTAFERLCRHESPQIKQDGIKLLRSIGRGSLSIQNRFAGLAREVVASSAVSRGAEDGDAAMIEAP